MIRRPRTMVLAAPPIPARIVMVLAALAALALLLPRLASAKKPAGQVELAPGVVRVMLPDAPGPLTVEWGAAPYAGKLLRVPAGTHAVELRGVEPGGVYVMRVLSNGVPLTRPTPFVVPGAPARVPGPAPVSM